jgi:toxin YoeB
MKLLWAADAWEDYLFWQETDRPMLRRVNELLKDACRDPFKGLGKPEPLKGDLSGWWSRRITGEHRLVYRITGRDEKQQIEIASCRYHYR